MKLITKKINPQILKLARRLVKQQPQSQVFLVGGPVRDLILGKKCKDYDLLVRNIRPKKLEALLNSWGKVNLVGKNFGVFKFQTSDIKYQVDIALPRTEHSIDQTGGYKDFKVQTNYKLSINDDLSRRDFTINALAYDLINDQLIDPFDGLKDIEKKTIRAVGKPNLRFAEDYSRLLRAIRFASQLNFKIEPKTWLAIKKLAKNINNRNSGEFIVPRETIAKELLKSFYTNPLETLNLLDKSGLLKQLIPELLKMKGCPQPANWHSEGDVWQHTILCLKNLISTRYKKKFPNQPSINLIMSVILHDIAKPTTIKTPQKHGSDRIRFNEHDVLGGQKAKEICQRLKLNSYKDENIDCNDDAVAWLAKNHMLAVHGPIAQIKNTTLEKYFFSDKPGDDLLQLLFLDGISTIPQKGEVYINHFQQLNKRVQQLSKLRKNKKQTLPKPLLNGDQIMQLAKLPPSPKVGKFINLLREEQLKKKITSVTQAKKFIKKLK
ncbi:MAG: CCA tRNA nucleotidyltransferase [Patescibacteria group bacterium]